MGWTATRVPESDVLPGRLHTAEVDGRPILFWRHGGELRAVDGACPHRGGELSDGRLEDGRLLCPLHGATFDWESGSVLIDPFGVDPPQGGVQGLVRYRTRVVDGCVEVDLTEGPTT